MQAAERLVGRGPELARAAGAIEQASQGNAAVLVVEGVAGIGKTRLARCIGEQARARELAVLWGQAHPFERTRPFGVMAEALGLNRRSSDPRRSALGVELAGPRAAGPLGPAGDLQNRVIEQIVDLVDTSCAARPCALVIEDAHWADSASLSAIAAVARQLTYAALLIVVTVRPAPLSAELLRLLDELTIEGGSVLRLQPLTSEEVTALATDLLGAPPGPGLGTLLARTAGNPLLAVAMLHALDADGSLRVSDGVLEVTTTEVPTSLNELVIRRLHDLPRSTVELLQVAAVLGDAVAPRDVAAVAGLSAFEVVARLGPAFDAQLLGRVDERVVFRHQLVHDAVYQHVPLPARRLLHREAADALMSAGADRLDVAEHLILGAERGDEEAVAWLREAAREASARAPLVTVELTRRAEALLPRGHPEADLVSTEMVQALLRAGQVVEASDRAEAVLARQHAVEVDVPLRLSLLGAFALQNRAAELVALAQASLAGSSRLGPPEEVLVRAQQSWALTYSGDRSAGEAAARRALAVAERIDDSAMTVWALTALLVAVGRAGRYGEALDHARRAAALAADHDVRSLPLQPKFFLGLALYDCDLVSEARTAYRAALDDEFASGWWLSDTLMADAQAQFAVGDWADAVPGLVAGGEAAQQKGNPLLVTQSLAYRAIIATGTGDLRLAKELTDGFARALDGEDLTYNAGILVYAAAGRMVAAGEQQGAYELLLRCWRYDAARENRFYHRWLAPDLVRLALAQGHREVAVEVAGDVAEGAALAPEVATVHSVALRCRGLVDQHVEPLLEGVALARRSPLLIEFAGSCEDAAELLALEQRQEEAAALLHEALDRYERAGADAWAARARGRLRAIGVRVGSRGSRARPAVGWASLTATERSVALLVAEGLTNGAVAKQLYISPHTVNTHLRHVFAKLDVSNRVALAVVVHRSTE